ncbi:MAG: zinc-regulated TonB-dependent outer membrane receptor [Alphaproteobacteria bacterium]|nr:zinc-regulated TonB-dependent outer membrane receptor [Alphaproteobacteria bacterium]MCB9796921.1 zinc-regulated TonB-dependent outer membrane receptor [Alphaproteobacteria bacterium]
MFLLFGLLWLPTALAQGEASTPPAADEEGDLPSPEAAPSQPADAEDPSDAGEDPYALSPEELAEIEAALGADAAALPQPTQPSLPQGLQGPATSSAPAGQRGAVNLQSMNPNLSFIADVALAGFNSDEPLQTGGHDPTTNGFNLQQLELSVGSAVDPYFRFDSNIVFSQFGVEIEEVYATTLGLPGRFQLRTGQFLTRFGRINNTHPHAWSFVDQPFAIGRIFGGEGNRGLGLEGSVLLPLPWYVELVASSTMANGASTARSFWGAQDLGVRSPADLQTTAALKQFFPLSDNWSLMTGLSYAVGPNASGRDNHSEVYGGDLYLRYRPISAGSWTIVSLTSEWMLRRRQISGDVLSDVNSYTQLFWQFARRWAVAARYELGTAPWDLSGEVALDPLDPSWTDLRQRTSANVTFWPTEFSRLRLQTAADMHSGRRTPDLSVFLACEFVVGAHGAHKF